MKTLLLTILFTLVLSGCLPDKSEKTIRNCADSEYSKSVVNSFNLQFDTRIIYEGWVIPKNVFQKNIITLKKADNTLGAVNEWAENLKTVEINDKNKIFIEFLVKEKNRINKMQDDFLKLEITDRLKDSIYERRFKKCEKERNEATKTFDLKWKKPKFYRAEFR